MDPRQARTRTALHRAILELATTKPIGELTVAEVARAAGITRDTFYRHAPSPEHLLAQLLDDELAILLAPIERLPARSSSELSVFDQVERELLAHVASRAPIYRSAMRPRLTGPIRDMLVERIELGLHLHLSRHPQIEPPREADVDPEQHRRLMVAYASGGTVSAIEEWLRCDDSGTSTGTPSSGRADAIARTIIAASPDWWLGRGS